MKMNLVELLVELLERLQRTTKLEVLQSIHAVSKIDIGGVVRYADSYGLIRRKNGSAFIMFFSDYLGKQKVTHRILTAKGVKRLDSGDSHFYKYIILFCKGIYILTNFSTFEI